MKDLDHLTSTILDPAISQEYGIKVRSNDADGLRRRLYVAIRKLREQGQTKYSLVKIKLLSNEWILVYLDSKPKETQQ